MKKKGLFILHLPPPLHGSSMVGSQLKNSKVINDSFNGTYINLNTSESVNDIGSMNLKKVYLFIKITFSICCKLLFNRYSIIYMAPTVSKGGAIKDGIIIFFINFFKKSSNVFLHLHNRGVSNKAGGKFWNLWYKMFFKNKKIIILSERLYKDISVFVKNENVVVCPNGVKIVEFKEQKTTNKIHLLYLSNLIKEKGIFDLLDACEIVKNKNYDFVCNIVGGEGDVSASELNSVITSKKLHQIVNYHGKKVGNQKEKILNQSDVFCFPTYYHNETFGLVNIEAMQSKLPIISTDIGGIPDIIDDGINGFIVDIKSPEQIAEKIIYFIENPDEVKRMGENGYEKFMKNYTLEIFEERLLQILKS